MRPSFLALFLTQTRGHNYQPGSRERGKGRVCVMSSPPEQHSQMGPSRAQLGSNLAQPRPNWGPYGMLLGAGGKMYISGKRIRVLPHLKTNVWRKPAELHPTKWKLWGLHLSFSMAQSTLCLDKQDLPAQLISSKFRRLAR